MEDHAEIRHHLEVGTMSAMLPAGTNIKEKSATSAISRLPQAGLDLSCSICNAELLTQPPSSR